nr:adaptor protein MecA [Mammaliicoccus sp. Marseille-Q6498]
MRIERIDETTVKLFITYQDIEARGFKREDLWTNRKRGEEFFWSMMDEINDEEEFVVEGPLWIQVHAFEKGVEVTVSKSKGDELLNMTDEDSNEQLEYQVNDFLSQALDSDQNIGELLNEGENESKDEEKHFVPKDIGLLVRFEELEDIIEYAHYNEHKDIVFTDLLYMLDNKYYYYVQFDQIDDEDIINDFYGQLLEYANPTQVSKLYLDDYAKVVMSYNVMGQVTRYFEPKKLN